MRNLSPSVFVVWQEDGGPDHRKTRRRRDTELHRPTDGGEGFRRDGAASHRRHVATSQRLYHAKQDAFTNNATDLAAYGFRQGGQWVTVVAADATTYCMQAPGGTDTFKMTQDSGRPGIR